MQTQDFEHFRDLLDERRHMINDWLNSGASLKETDARLVRDLLNQIKDALTRIENENYGCCDVCHDDVEHERLEVQPIRRVCLDCISDEEKAVLEEDLYLAGKIHRALLPQTVPQIKGFDVELRSEATGNIGGDYYDFIPAHNGEWTRIVIADAMGHGLPAGLLMSNLQSALRILSSDIDSPGPLLTRLNEWLCRNVPVTKFVSLACLCMKMTDEDGTRISYANAGHVPPLVVRADGSVEQLDATGVVLGIHEGFAFEEQEFTLDSGDYLVLYTDGVTETKNAAGEEFEQDRLVEFIRGRMGQSFKGVVDDLVRTVTSFSGGSQPADDLTAIILRKR